MNIEDTLREQLPDLSAEVQGGPSLHAALQKGRARRRLRATAAFGTAAAVVCASAVVSVAALTGSETRGSEPVSPAIPAEPEDVPGLVDDAVRAQLPDGTEVTYVELRAYKNDEKLPRSQWDESTDWSATYMLGSEEQVSVSLMHAAGETEGPAAKLCRQDVKAGFYLSCDFSEQSGAEVFQRESAMRNDGRAGARTPGPWFGLLPARFDEPNNPELDEVDPGRVWFDREVEVQPGGDYLIRVGDTVHVPTHRDAESRWTLDAEALREIATDPRLLEDPAPSEPDDDAGVSEVEPQRVQSSDRR